MPKRSCLTNLLLEEITAQVDNSHPVDIIYMDFAKVFDKVPHRRLLEKLKAHGIGPKLIKWRLCNRNREWFRNVNSHHGKLSSVGYHGGQYSE